MQEVYNYAKSKALDLATSLTPILKNSKFKETGVLTPEEFVIAGDHLVHHCPTWQWESGNQGKAHYLPENKQYLVTKKVPCYKRVKQLETNISDIESIIEPDADGGWVNTHPNMEGIEVSGATNNIGTLCIDDEPPRIPDSDDDDDDDDDNQPAVDLEDLEQLEEEDSATATITTQIDGTETNTVSGILQTRTYDLHITYDKFYQTPRLWLNGYDEQGKPLNDLQTSEDISQDHNNKTITLENHPHKKGVAMLTVHPCRHAEVMKKLIETYADSGNELEVYMYIIIFLKFVQAVIPTIEYDFTREIRHK